MLIFSMTTAAAAVLQVLVTDTTMRDAHQSLLATRVRTEDLVHGATVANEVERHLGREKRQ